MSLSGKTGIALSTDKRDLAVWREIANFDANNLFNPSTPSRKMAKVIIIGGGPAGCEAAHQLANQGIDVELVEKNNETGGNLNNW